MSDRILTPIIALGLAFLVWMYTRSRDLEVIDNAQIPVEVQIAASQADLYELEVLGPLHAPISFTGLPSRMRELRSLLQRGDLRLAKTVTVPEEHLADPVYVDVLRLEPTSLELPPGVRAVIPESQGKLRVTLRRLIEKQLPVRLQTTAGDRLEQVTLDPKEVVVRGPKDVLQNAEWVPTQLYAPAARVEGVVQETPTIVPLVRELAGRPIRTTPGEVAVRYTLKPRQKVHELVDVPVTFLCPANFAYRPQFSSDREGRITLKVQGPSGENRPAVIAYVDLTTRKFGPGLHAEEPIQVQLPAGFQLAQETPRLPSFKLLPADPTMKPPDVPFPP
jgi:sulfur carrier protein ThiS